MSRLFWSLFAKRYAAGPVADEAAYAHKLALTTRYLDPSMRLLEVGCGTGTTALYHAPRVAHVTGVDYARPMVEIATAKAEAAGIGNVTFRQGRVEDLAPPPEGPYDMALALSLLHLLPDPRAGLRKLVGLLRPGGYVVSSTVCIGEMGGAVARLLPLAGRTGLIPRVAPLTRDGVRRMHEELGLTVVEEFRQESEPVIFLIARVP